MHVSVKSKTFRTQIYQPSAESEPVNNSAREDLRDTMGKLHEIITDAIKTCECSLSIPDSVDCCTLFCKIK